MKKTTILILGSLALYGLPVELSWAEASIVTQKKSVKELKREGKQLLARKDYQGAFLIYQGLVRFSPTDKEANLGLAQSANAVGEYSHAILAYERLLVSDPHNSDYHIQLAYIYAYVGDAHVSEEEIHAAKSHNVKGNNELDKKLTLEFNRLRVPYKPVEPSYFWQGQVGVGLLYDSNASQGTDVSTLNFGVFNNVLPSDAKKVSSWADYAKARIEGGKRIKQLHNWWVVGDSAVYQRWNFNSAMQNNNGSLLGRLAAGVMYLGQNLRVDTRMKQEFGRQYNKQSQDQRISTYGPELSAAYTFSPQWKSVTNLYWEHRDYRDPDEDSGNFWSVGEYVQRRFTNIHTAFFGIRSFGSNAKDNNLSHKGYEFMVTGDAKLVNNLSLNPFVIYQNRHYDGPATTLETEKRKDRQWRSGFSVNWHFAKNMSMENGYQYISNHSNSDRYRYKQHVVNTGFIWRF